MNRQWLLLALLVTSASASAEQVYKWTDAAGVTHYSDAPPPADAQNVQTMRVSGGASHNGAPAPQSAEQTVSADSSTRTTASNGAGPAADDARAKNCNAAHHNLELLQSGVTVTAPGADGNQALLDDKQRQARIAEANAQITLFCK